MIKRLVLFGATGDLAGRFLLPALAELHEGGFLPADFRVVATAREDWDDDTFRQHAAQQLEQHAGSDVGAASRDAVVQALRYRNADVTDVDSVAHLVALAGGAAGNEEAEPIAAYLALPASVFAPAVRALGGVGLPSGSRIVLEKPFGEDLESAVALNELLRQVTGVAGEQAIFRVDHALGMATVQNLLAVRLANRVLAAVWNSTHIEQSTLR